MAATSELAVERPYAAKAVSNREGKGRIASLAAGLISPGDTVILDSGSTIFELAKRLVLLRDLTVITNDLKIALELSGSSTCTVICLGGVVQNRVYSVIGNYVEAMLGGLRANKAFIGASGICPDGAFTPTIEKAPVKRAMIAAADEPYLLVDHTKFGKRALVKMCDLSAFAGVVTDRPVTGTVLEDCASKGLRFLVAGEDPGARPQTDGEGTLPDEQAATGQGADARQAGGPEQPETGWAAL